MSNQLVKKNPAEGYQNVFPKTFIDAIKDKESGVSLQEILQGFNMYFLSYNGSRALTRCKVPAILRKEGLWITYVLYDHTVVTEWYNSDQIDDNSWSMDSNWRVASNFLVGDVSVSADGYWIINGEKTEAKAQGEQGVTPLLRVGANNKLQVSYNAGKAWRDISDYIVPRFRWNQGIGTSAGNIQISMDLGKTWTNLSNEITNNLRISRYIGINESLPTSGIAEGTIYMKGPYYDESDTSNTNPIYRMWVYAWKGNTLAWQDNGEFTSISAGVVQERGTSATEVMSQDAVTKELTELGQKADETNAKALGLKASGGVLFNKRFLPSDYSKIIDEDGYCITGFIPVDSSQLVYIYANSNSVWNVYNANKEYLRTESCTGGNITTKNLSTYTNAAYLRGCVVTDSFNNMWLKNNDTYIIFDNTLAEKIFDVNSDIATLTQLTQREYTDILSEGGFEFYKAQQSDGTVIDSVYQCISPYIDVSSNRNVIVYLGGNAGMYCAYNENKEFVDYYNVVAEPTARILPESVHYLRLNIRLTDVNNAYVGINDGTDRKLWVSFVTWSKRVTDLEARFVNLNGRVNDVYPLLENGEYSYHKRIDGANIYNDRPFIVSPYIDIRNNRSLEIFLNGNRTMYVHGYDSEKNYLDYWSIATGETMTRVFPNTIYYIRVCYDINRQDGVFVKSLLNGDVIWRPFPYWQGALESGDIIALHPHKKVYSLLANLKNNIDPMTIRPYGDDNLTLLFFSDLHACATPLERIGKFAEEYCIDNNIKYIDAVVAGGDNVNRATDNYTFWEQCGARSFLPVVGNHELLIPEDKVSTGEYQTPQINGVNVAINSMPYSAKFVYEREFAPFLSATNFTSIVENKCYWYKDFANAKIRLIGIDDYHWKESPIRLTDNTLANEYPDGETLDNGEQLEWFENTLASAKSLGYSVIVVHHAPARFDSPIQCSFTSLDFQNNIATDPTSPSGAPYTKEPFEAVQSFIDGGGKFICWLTGHLHQDAVGVVKGYTDQFQMTIDTARYGYDSEGRSLGNGLGHNAHIPETTSADCMNIVSVDTYHKQLSLVRIGSNYDRRGRHIGTFVWDYEHKQMLSCD